MQRSLPQQARIVVMGTAGAGKTWLSKHIASGLQIPRVDLEALHRKSNTSHWNPNLLHAPDEVFQRRVEEAIRSEAWVVDGGFARGWVWPRAQTLVWLDYPVYIPLWRALRRWVALLFSSTVPRDVKFHQLIQFFSRHSVIPWCISHHRRCRRLMPSLLKNPQFAHLNVVRLRAPAETGAWLQQLLAGKSLAG